LPRPAYYPSIRVGDRNLGVVEGRLNVHNACGDDPLFLLLGKFALAGFAGAAAPALAMLPHELEL
jgi:hypothetical protein